jgi:hypothetical protein
LLFVALPVRLFYIAFSPIFEYTRNVEANPFVTNEDIAARSGGNLTQSTYATTKLQYPTHPHRLGLPKRCVFV